MISSIEIYNYRGFQRFQMSGLGRINLLVGTNNSGKTSVLEALFLLASRGDPAALWNVLWRRGERQLISAPAAERARRQRIELDISHLFHGHELYPGASFSISATNRNADLTVAFSVKELTPREQGELFGPEEEGALASRLALEVEGRPRPIIPLLPLSRVGGLPVETIEFAPRGVRRRESEAYPSVFITPESLNVNDLLALWDKVSLTPAEGMVLRALQFVDGDIERIAAQTAIAQIFHGPGRGGFIVKRKGSDQPIPIGTLGDGVWRMLAMAIAVTQCRGGVLLVDEIDTGLHYSIMAKMWQMILNAAREFDVQLFATTHSHDCVYSLAHVSDEADGENAVTVQRVEPGREEAVPYTQSELRVAADHEIEVR